MNFPWDKNKSTKMIKQIQSVVGVSSDRSFLQYKEIPYPDGSKYVEVFGGNVLIYRINNYEDLWILGQINDVLEHQKRKCTLIIPNLLDGQADRRFSNVQPHGLKMVCNFINSMRSFDKIYIYHPHNAEVVEALIDRVDIIDNSEFVRQVLLNIEDEGKSELVLNSWINKNLILMSSDAGGLNHL